MRRWYIIAMLFACAVLVCAYFLGRADGVHVATAGQVLNLISEGQRGVVQADGDRKPARSSTSNRMSAPLPSNDLPLKDAFAELQARANAGDPAAATRLYRDLGLCSRFHGIDRANTQLADELLREKVDTADPQQLENYQVQLDAIETRKQVMQRFHTLCDGADEAMLEALVPNLRKAAELGEGYARACYLQKGPSFDSRHLMNHPEWLDAYRTGVSSMINAGMEAGDWRVVDILRNAYQPGAESPLAGVLGSDSYQYYRYLKLYRLGAEQYRAEQLDQLVLEAASKLTPAQLADADAWAQSIFQQNFNSSSSTESTIQGWDPCSFPYE
jgi:hypothetical protein